MKKLTLHQMREILAAAEERLATRTEFPNPPLERAVEKLREGIRIESATRARKEEKV